MSRRYDSFDSDPSGQAFLDNLPHHDSATAQQHPSQEPYRDQSPAPRRFAHHPGNHPDSVFARSRQQQDTRQTDSAAFSHSANNPAERSWRPDSQFSTITPGADNFSSAAGGGISGLAMTVAERNARESGLNAMRATQDYHQEQNRPYPQAYQRGQPQPVHDENYGYDQNYSQHYNVADGHSPYDHGHGSPSALPTSAYAGPGTPARSMHSYSSDPFRDPQMTYGQRMDPRIGQVDPNDIDDDGDDGLEYRRSARNSMLSLGNISNRNSSGPAVAGAGVAGGAAAGGVLGGILGRNRNSSGNYGPVQNPGTAYHGAGGAAANEYELGVTQEKPSEWIQKNNSSRKKYSWTIGILVFLIIAGAVAGGVAGYLLNKKKSGSNGGGESAQQDQDQNGDLNINSQEIQDLLNNKNLHKVFPGVDYTPINTQYPACLTDPPSQNNVTRDLAVLSQLTNTIRLYGTDCNQTEMLIHAIDQLQMKDDIKIWMGVWLENNDTTNARQQSQMWNILDTYGDSYFTGVIVGNEVLFRKDLTETQLGDILDNTRKNMTANNWNLPVATSDLGANWTPTLANFSDYIMGNVHPFFSGEPVGDAANWATSFWDGQISSFKKSDASKNVIAEIGWPTQGGTDCGTSTVTSCANGAVASIDNLNTMLSTWVCQALANGTTYFWFELFDEPWKIIYDTDGEDWEDHWGLMDVDRNLKSGVTIPDCGGKTVS
ncbi:glycoside hydrolase superfamily [Xylariaceae sp. FL0255]|nr:glycoside hydrolase superfamily [Xylariaceae sp. FL0255]